jgi:hypothetical protein
VDTDLEFVLNVNKKDGGKKKKVSPNIIHNKRSTVPFFPREEDQNKSITLRFKVEESVGDKGDILDVGEEAIILVEHSEGGGGGGREREGIIPFNNEGAEWEEDSNINFSVSFPTAKHGMAF